MLGALLTLLLLLSRVDFYHANWNLQLFRFRCRTLETTLFAYDALVYQNYDVEVKARASPLDYIFQQLEYMLENWEAILLTSSNFLSSFVSFKDLSRHMTLRLIRA